MYVFFDTETNGLAKNWKAPMSDVDNWPRIAQIAWQIYDENEELVSEFNSMIKPDGWTIPKEQFFIDNNMSTERCEEEGVDIKPVLEKFIEDVGNSKHLIAHNMKFDDNVVGAEMIRAGISFKKEPSKICTMQESTNYCKMQPFRYGTYKWPTLLELHEKLFGEGFDGAHDAMADVKAAAKAFFELKNRSVILQS